MKTQAYIKHANDKIPAGAWRDFFYDVRGNTNKAPVIFCNPAILTATPHSTAATPPNSGAVALMIGATALVTAGVAAGSCALAAVIGGVPATVGGVPVTIAATPADLTGVPLMVGGSQKAAKNRQDVPQRVQCILITNQAQPFVFSVRTKRKATNPN